MVNYNCLVCRKTFQTYPCRVRSGMVYCSKTCSSSLRTKIPVSVRFWEKVDKLGPIHKRLGSRCWLWVAHTHKKGHGMLSDWPGMPLYAHRVSWELRYGPVTGERHVLHKCDIPNCVNPRHLYLGTNLDNIRDRVLRGRSLKGEACPSSKLTAAKAVAIRAMRLKGATLGKIGRRFGVAASTVCNIVKGRIWKSEK